MDWDDLRIFLSVVREESLSGAGRALRLDPATVGRRIARLEAAMDAALFVKSPLGYVPTEAGVRLIEHAEAVERAARSAAAQVKGAEERLTGVLRIGAPDGCASYLLPAVTARLSQAYPDLELQIVALPRVFNLSRREADLAIGVSPPSAGRLKVQKITDYRLSLAASRGYLDRHAPIAGPEDLRGHKVVGYIPDMIFDRELDYLSEFGIERVTFGSNLVAVHHGWLKAGVGIGVIHDFALSDLPDLVPVLRGAVHLKRSFWLIRHEDDTRIARLNRFAGALVQELRDEVSRRSAA